jgi:hypothetical protein
VTALSARVADALQRGHGPACTPPDEDGPGQCRCEQAVLAAELRDAPTHDPCCSAHGVPMTCARYRRTHFVEVRPCCSADAEALMDVVDDALDQDDAPSPPPPCPGCGGAMGDGDRVHHGQCGRCRIRSRRAQPPCWCGRTISTLRGASGAFCAEHDDPIPAVACAPSEPLTPGGVFGDRPVEVLDDRDLRNDTAWTGSTYGV